MQAHVVMRSFPFLTADLAGNYYYREPDKNRVAFTSGLPLVAQQFDKLYPHIEGPSQWQELYVVTTVSDDGRTAHFKLVPRKRGNVESIDATVDDKSATMTSMRWNYNNGGYAEMTNRYGQVEGNLVIESQSGHVDEPGYVADVTSTISDYTINPTLPDSVFEDMTAVSLIDGFSRPITYLRVSVTDKCNLRCMYCMPEGGLPWLQRDEILSYEEIAQIVACRGVVGVRAIRLTGGEPLVRRDLSRLVAAIASVPGIDDMALSTNGLLLEEQLPGLVAAGLRRVNFRWTRCARPFRGDRAAARTRCGAARHRRGDRSRA